MKMPSIFKKLVSISVWVLFIKGLLDIVVGGGSAWASVVRGGGGNPALGVMVSGLGVTALILACVAAWLRKKLEKDS
jgi:H+/gluconate symporter-like permease